MSLILDKSEVKCRFRRSVESYDENAHVQKLIVEKLYKLLQLHLSGTPRHVLEIGCGTGLLTRKLAGELKPDRLFINDLVYEMCSKTATTCGLADSSCLTGDVEELALPGTFDLIVSTSTFQWFTHLPATLEKLAASLLPGGLMVFSTFGKYNLHELRATTGSGLCYPSKEDISELLLPFFDILRLEEEKQVLYFSSPLEILQHLKKTGVNASASDRIWTKGQISRFSDDFQNRYAVDGQYPLTYHPLYFVCRKREEELR